MHKKKHLFIKIIYSAIFISFFSVFSFYYISYYSYYMPFNEPSIETLSKFGSRGDEVVQIQTKLKRWGYYKGNIDGIFGYQTLAAVRLFQSKNGLVVDGIAGPKTLAAMGIFPASAGASRSAAATTSFEKDVRLLAHLIHAEGRGEPYLGQVAIGAVVVNRVRDERFPNTIAGVIYQPGAFDVVTDGQINLPPNETAFRAARDAMNGWDPTNGCIYYYNPAKTTNKWIWSRPVMLRIGDHNFAK